MLVVILVTILATLASPIVVREWRERHGRQAAIQVAQIYSQARMRAMSRGAAVLVRWDKDKGFVVEEAIEGKTAATARKHETCAEQPGLGCLSNGWGNWGDTTETKRVIEEYKTENYAALTAKNGGGSAITKLNICFNPMGRSYISYDGTNPTTAMVSTPSFDVQRIDNKGGGTYVSAGMVRKVVLLPNGMARLAL